MLKKKRTSWITSKNRPNPSTRDIAGKKYYKRVEYAHVSLLPPYIWVEEILNEDPIRAYVKCPDGSKMKVSLDYLNSYRRIDVEGS